MNVRKAVQRGRRARRPNGDARLNTPWTVKGVEEPTRIRVSLLANRLGTTNGAIIDLASKLLLKELNLQDRENAEKGITFSNTFADYISILEDNDSSTNDPAVIELEKSLQKRREARDKLMGREPANASPDPSKSYLGA